MNTNSLVVAGIHSETSNGLEYDSDDILYFYKSDAMVLQNIWLILGFFLTLRSKGREGCSKTEG